MTRRPTAAPVRSTAARGPQPSVPAACNVLKDATRRPRRSCTSSPQPLPPSIRPCGRHRTRRRQEQPSSNQMATVASVTVAILSTPVAAPRAALGSTRTMTTRATRLALSWKVLLGVPTLTLTPTLTLSLGGDAQEMRVRLSPRSPGAGTSRARRARGHTGRSHAGDRSAAPRG